MAFSEEDRHVIKCLRESKHYSAKRLLKEFPEKGWKLGGLNALLRKIDSTGSVQRQAGSGRPRSARTVHNIDCVNELILSQEDMPQSHRSQRQIAREVGIFQSSVNGIIRNDLRLQCFKKQRAHELTDANKLARLQRSRQLLRRFPSSLVNFIWFTDEKLFTVAAPSNSQNDRVYAAFGTKKKNIPANRLLRTRPTFSKTLMVSVGISALGRTDVHFVEPGVKINGQYYRDVLLMKGLLPDIRRFSDFFIFQQDGAPAHRARETVELLQNQAPDFIEPSMWPPNSPDLNPVDYKIWSAMEQKVYGTKLQDTNELRRRILDAWNELDQGVIDASVQQWRVRLRASVEAEGGQFEQKL